ncbi:hypothetical protein LINPERHAP1_LOCUS9132 [Linum perenne]
MASDSSEDDTLQLGDLTLGRTSSSEPDKQDAYELMVLDPVSNLITMVKFKYAGFRKALGGGKKIVVELPDEGILLVGHLLSFMG